MQTLFPNLEPRLRSELDALPRLIDKTFPLPHKFRNQLPKDIRDLSRLLTSNRSQRDDGYLGRPALLSAYLRYFVPWNIYRLSRLLSGLEISLNAGDTLLDLGSGPLTLPLALYLSRPELRTVPLQCICLDRNAAALDAGKKLFKALAPDSVWKLKTIRGSLGVKIEGTPVKLLSAANLFNELFWDDRSSLSALGGRYARMLSGMTDEAGSILVVEPGIPRSGAFISSLRENLIQLGRSMQAPCPHQGSCPLPGLRKGSKWCHFAFSTEDAPSDLHKLSAAAGIPKERASLSFLYSQAHGEPTGLAAAQQGAPSAQGSREGPVKLAVRILSDAFSLGPATAGRYACSERGLVLVHGKKNRIDGLESGYITELPLETRAEQRDKKSGALMLPFQG